MNSIDFAKKAAVLPSKQIASEYVTPLLSEGILKVTKDHVTIMQLTIERSRMIWFHLALTQLRSPDDLLPVRQGVRGFTVEKIKAARGNDVLDAYKITSNADDKGVLIVTRDLAAELWELVHFFVTYPDHAENFTVETLDTTDIEEVGSEA